ncbi:MAG: hypothetical protein R3F34_15155 [Planctomycetota bacterium]
MKLRTLAAAGLAVALLHAPARAQESEGSGGSGLPPIPDVPETMTVDDAIAARDRAIGFLVASQNPDGSWGSASNELFAEAGFSVETYYAWKGASHGLAMMALQSAPETPERRAALDKAIDWFLEMRIPQRGSDWDVDYSWTAQYCFVAATRLATDPRFSTGERGGRSRSAARRTGRSSSDSRFRRAAGPTTTTRPSRAARAGRRASARRP